MQPTRPQFELWLETETGEPLDQPANRPQQNFCNVTVTFDDGRTYAINVWTFDFLPLARYPWPYESNSGDQPANYVLPPDLFVTRLTRETISNVVSQLITHGSMKDEWLVDPED